MLDGPDTPLKVERKNFTPETIEAKLKEQGNQCAKCGDPFGYQGFEAHHIDGNKANNAPDNCALLHPRCHDAELWKTLQEQKKAALTHVQDTIKAALGPQGLAGAILKEVAGLIDKEISLTNQIYGMEHFETPAKDRIEYSTAVAQANLEAFTQGYQECLKQIPLLLEGKVIKVAKQ